LFCLSLSPTPRFRPSPPPLEDASTIKRPHPLPGLASHSEAISIALDKRYVGMMWGLLKRNPTRRRMTAAQSTGLSSRTRCGSSPQCPSIAITGRCGGG
jgi:hypothetical protein